MSLGNLNQAELTWVLQPLLSPAPSVITSASSTISPVSTLNLHNTLLAAIYANTLRDPPPSEVAPWVVATDKPTSTAKNASSTGTNDKTEERLRKEVMGIHARDRKRIKGMKEGGKGVSDGFSEMQEYRNELAVKPPDITPQSAGGITRTNWELEIRKRYAQPLAEETLEFPTINEMQNRIEPICYEEGVTGGAGGAVQTCAELMEQATEVFLKELLGTMFAHSRSNGEDCIQTSGFKRQLRKEEADVERGVLQRNAVGLLPVEMEDVNSREPLNMEDLRLALMLEDRYLKADPFLEERVLLSRYPSTQEEKPKMNGIFAKPAVNGVPSRANAAAEDVTAIDDGGDAGHLNWKGGNKRDMDDLMGVLDDCLAVG